MAFLVAYYVPSCENTENAQGAASLGEKTAVETVAHRIASFTEASIFKIEQLEPYSADYQQCVAEAVAHKEADARPELKLLPRDLDDYDEIFIAFPSYGNTVPMAVLTFLESFDFEDKTIRPVCIHEGEGMGSAQDAIARVCPTALHEEGIAIASNQASTSANAIEGWLKRVIGPIIW
ncbi:MAG: flavodoxin [Anaerotardibacter sp.]